MSQVTSEIPPLLREPRRFKAFVFDVDGTLYRAAPVRRAMVRRLLLGHLLNPLRGYRVIRGLSAFRRAQEALRGSPSVDLAREQLERGAEASGVPLDTLREWVGHWMEEAPLELIAKAVWPGLMDFLRRARDVKQGLGVVSDYPAKAKLEVLGMEPLFPVVVSAQDVGAFKPDPRGLEQAIEQLGVGPDAALYIGDRRDVDAEAARRAGVACVIVGGSKSVVEHDGFVEVPDFWELRSILF